MYDLRNYITLSWTIILDIIYMKRVEKKHNSYSLI